MQRERDTRGMRELLPISAAPAPAPKNVTNKPKAASSNIATRVTGIEKPNSLYQTTRYASTPGGCTFGVVECATHDPLRSKSRAVGMNFPCSSQKKGNASTRRWMTSKSPAGQEDEKIILTLSSRLCGR